MGVVWFALQPPVGSTAGGHIVRRVTAPETLSFVVAAAPFIGKVLEVYSCLP